MMKDQKPGILVEPDLLGGPDLPLALGVSSKNWSVFTISGKNQFFLGKKKFSKKYNKSARSGISP